MVARGFLPPSPSENIHPPDRPVASPRPWAAARHRRCFGRRHYNPRTSRTDRPIEGERVVGRVRRHPHEVCVHLVDQADTRRRVIGRRLSHRAGHDHAGSVHAEMELPPASSPDVLRWTEGYIAASERPWRRGPRRGRSAWHAYGWVSREPGRPHRLHLKGCRGAGTGSPSPRPWTAHLASDGATRRCSDGTAARRQRSAGGWAVRNRSVS